MKRSPGIGWIFLALSLAPAPLWAQFQKPAATPEGVPLKPFVTEDGLPVMRAQPARPPAPEEVAKPAAPLPALIEAPAEKPPLEKPPVVEKAPDEKPIRRALPVTRPATARGGTPAASTPAGATPRPEDKKPELADPTGEIRISPQGTMTQEQVQLSIADSFYVRKSFDQAAPEYEKYLGLYPSGSDRASVLYRLAESYRSTGSINAARSTYETLVTQFPNSEVAGPAAYRMAELYYQERNFSNALPYYQRSIGRLKDPKLSNSAKFFAARSYEGLGRKMDARIAYEDLLTNAQDNPFFDASRLSLALLLKEANRTIDALRHIEVLAQQSANEELQAQATVYAGLWKLELGQTEKAAEDLKKALTMPAAARWSDVAQLGLLKLYFSEKKYQQVIETYKTLGKDFASENRAQILSLVAMATRQLGKSDEAIALFEQIAKEFPNTPAARDAAYERLVSLYSANSPTMLADIDQFLASSPEPSKNDQVLLMKAELLFKKADYAGAAPLYSQVESSRTMSVLFRGEALSKYGWCLMQTHDYPAAVKAYSLLVERYPALKSLPAALVQRGLARIRIKDLAGAIHDFDELNQRFPRARERELALEQKALAQGQMNNNPGMAATFKLLLKDFPETPAAAEANYWMGWVAFENKDYKAATEPLDKARALDKEQYFERASLRILLAQFYLENKEALAREIDVYVRGGAKRPVPYEVIHWLGHGYYDTAVAADKAEPRAAAYREAVKYLFMLTSREEVKAEDFLDLGRSELNLLRFQKAAEWLEKYLSLSKDPAPRAVGLLALGQAQIGIKNLDAATKSAQAVLGLQPDGELNARARILVGDIENERGNFSEAARTYETVSVVIDEETITPQALEKGVEAYKAAGREADAKRLLNTLRSRYPEYLQKKTAKS